MKKEILDLLEADEKVKAIMVAQSFFEAASDMIDKIAESEGGDYIAANKIMISAIEVFYDMHNSALHTAMNETMLEKNPPEASIDHLPN